MISAHTGAEFNQVSIYHILGEIPENVRVKNSIFLNETQQTFVCPLNIEK